MNKLKKIKRALSSFFLIFWAWPLCSKQMKSIWILIFPTPVQDYSPNPEKPCGPFPRSRPWGEDWQVGSFWNCAHRTPRGGGMDNRRLKRVPSWFPQGAQGSVGPAESSWAKVSWLTTSHWTGYTLVMASHWGQLPPGGTWTGDGALLFEVSPREGSAESCRPWKLPATGEGVGQSW